ncbi:protein-export membrane protein SecD [Magnetococcus marinus MC-1]|uniref:Protein translocase subunit SecD n=1 Tax=Magnetococcus marinus (strain ATCC BAA-1437 / JCM 17883 / MC-1) TaxID=156889 RepID=SECD_MAGMM|nr:protein translocase subunit SecD [Magnetococcus marinus]A0LCK9.1 RecName: Full=Protein translocase subunit SecD [Magnetococcus marinus MC-1]ABK45702.1 protein-export membrane protein SecD [Magnetococcus marinus MC-1]
MRQQPRWKLYLVVLVALGSIYYALPSLLGGNLPSWMPNKVIHQGLDLQGGLYLLYDVKVEEAIKQAGNNMVDSARNLLRKERQRYRGIEQVGADQVVIRLTPNSDTERMLSVLKDELRESKVEHFQPEAQIRLTLGEAEKVEIRKFAVDQAIEIIRNRIDAFGVSEPSIQKQGERRIIVQLPGIKNPDRAKGLIGRTARLDFKLVNEKGDLNRALEGQVPADSELMYEERSANQGGKSAYPLLVFKRTILSGQHIQNAQTTFNEYNEPIVSVKFDAVGGRKFSQITGEHIKERLAIVLDGKVQSAPVIQDKIAGGRATISGSFTREEAHDLAIVLRAGALPAPLVILEERTVGPTLGADSVAQGLNSVLIGGVLVVLFMVLYYKGFGMLANLAVVLNVTILVSLLALMQATLTLPGIAGAVLLLGMAVDANVLIFERIREELRLGKSPLAAIDHGYSKAFSTILDANITTLITAVILYQFGTGPVRGFAVTLSVGLLASMFTAIFVTRVVLAEVVKNRRLKTLSI